MIVYRFSINTFQISPSFALADFMMCWIITYFSSVKWKEADSNMETVGGLQGQGGLVGRMGSGREGRGSALGWIREAKKYEIIL